MVVKRPMKSKQDDQAKKIKSKSNSGNVKQHFKKYAIKYRDE